MRRFPFLALALTVAALGCSNSSGGAPPAGAVTLGSKATDPRVAQMPEGVPAQLDSGNAAYRAHDYAEAAKHFHKATQLGPQQAAAWYGVYMAEHALGHTAAADSAAQIANKLAPGVLAAHSSVGNPHQGMTQGSTTTQQKAAPKSDKPGGGK